jgi:hypothetical protein
MAKYRIFAGVFEAYYVDTIEFETLAEAEEYARNLAIEEFQNNEEDVPTWEDIKEQLEFEYFCGTDSTVPDKLVDKFYWDYLEDSIVYYAISESFDGRFE